MSHSITELADRTGLRWRLFVIFGAMFVAQAVGSIFNITYNMVHITPLLSENQAACFHKSIQLYNIIAYPALVFWWGWIVFSLCRKPEDKTLLEKLKRRTVALPFYASIIAAAGWALSIPALFMGLKCAGEPIDSHVWFHLPVSVIIAMLIALSLGYLMIDCFRMRLIFPYFFDKTASPAKVLGGHGLTVSGRGVLLMLSGSICPILALLMLLISPSPSSKNLWFAVGVAGAGIGFAICGTLLLRRLIADPVAELGAAAQAIGAGNKDVEVSNLRADEFGILADDFNDMVFGLKEKERIETTFGRHVGRKVAFELMKNEVDLSGVEREVSVLFSDIRGFTTLSESVMPREAVQLLNLYHETMTAAIEDNGGIISSIMGDGFMAIFGATGEIEKHANRAVTAGKKMFNELPALNSRIEALGFQAIKIGVGVNSGPTVVGSIGSPRRLEYTAIGDTVNTAARIESMTKDLDSPMLISSSTWERCDPKPEGEKLPPHPVRGRAQEIQLYSVEI
ncbi:MAG: adenylate/guanylate cyclase domain-containing protein [Luteolibacter sp.]